jgi:hypothetical protein
MTAVGQLKNSARQPGVEGKAKMNISFGRLVYRRVFLLLLAAGMLAAWVGMAEAKKNKAVQAKPAALAKFITGEKARQLADAYLKTMKLNWGESVGVTWVDRSGSILVKGKDGSVRTETWSPCYYVQYLAPGKEADLGNLKAVVVTQDGQKAGIPISEQ